MEIDKRLFTKLQCINYTWRDLYRDVVEFWESNKTNLISELEDLLRKSEEEREEIDSKVRRYLEDKKLAEFLKISPYFKNIDLESYIYYTELVETKKVREEIRKKEVKKRIHLLDMSMISNASIKMMREVIKFIHAAGGSFRYDDLRLIIGDKDPHHQVNNAIRLDLIEKKEDILTLTELGRKYVSANEKEKKEILRIQIENIEIFDFLLRRLRFKKEISEEELFDIMGAIRGEKYAQRTSIAMGKLIVKWLKELDFIQYNPETGILTYSDKHV